MGMGCGGVPLRVWVGGWGHANNAQAHCVSPVEHGHSHLPCPVTGAEEDGQLLLVVVVVVVVVPAQDTSEEASMGTADVGFSITKRVHSKILHPPDVSSCCLYNCKHHCAKSPPRPESNAKLPYSLLDVCMDWGFHGHFRHCRHPKTQMVLKFSFSYPNSGQYFRCADVVG